MVNAIDARLEDGQDFPSSYVVTLSEFGVTTAGMNVANARAAGPSAVEGAEAAFGAGAAAGAFSGAGPALVPH